MKDWPQSESVLAPLARWFDTYRRELPWRARDLDVPHPAPWRVLVSELMLQQTQAATVIPYFERWMARWPSPEAAAAADPDEIHKAWEGLGYYQRARHLQAAAQAITGQGWPKDLASLLALPGLGPYAAAAVAAIAFQRPEPALDGNAFRVLARLLRIESDPRSHVAALRTWVRPALVALGPSRLTQALMDLGALICTRRPACEACPLAPDCAARQAGLERVLPLPRPRRILSASALWLLAIEAEGCWLLREPASKGLLAGLWTWPSRERSATSEDLAAEGPQAPGVHIIGVAAAPAWCQVYTHRREDIHPLVLHLSRRPPAPAGLRWVLEGSLADLALGRRDQRMRALLGTAREALPPGTPLGPLLGGLFVEP